MEFIFALEPSLLLVLIAIFGLIIGSFLNVVIVRLPIMLQKDWLHQCQEFLSENYQISLPQIPNSNQSSTFNIVIPSSHCPKCGHKIRAWENIPLLSYLLLKGQCRYCQEKISIRYPFIEILTAALSIITFLQFGLNLITLFALLLTWSLIVLTWIDIDEQILPDSITLPFLWLGLILNINGLFCPLPEAILGAAIGYLSLWSLYWIFKLLTGKEGMGYGDFKLMAMLGAWLGIKCLLPIVLISSMVGAVIGISLIIFKNHEKEQPIPFGPFIALGGWITLIWGDQLINAYFNMIGLPA